MRASPNGVPRPAVLQAALRKTTETLACELAHPTTTTPGWSEFEWRVAKAVAAMHGVSPLLSTRLRWRGPCGWMQFLEEQREHTAKRHVRIEKLLRLIDLRSREEGLAVVALKGAALHEAGLYRPGERPMADVDLLVHPRDAARMAVVLQSLGFYESRTAMREREFSPVDHRIPDELGEHSENNVKIELHERIGETLPMDETDITEIVFPRRPRPGLNAYPSMASLMTHLLLHAAGAMAFQYLRLMHLHDLALLSLHMTDADWSELLAHRAADRGHWWAYPPLQMSARYYSPQIPSHVLSEFSAKCPKVLRSTYQDRRLSDVSLSYLWVDAFPGIAWSRSVAEMLRYAASRIHPSGETVGHRERAANTDAWASRGDWPRLSQSRRILRWVVSRPTRTRTMHAVRVALARPA
jgi:hypothetical protein